jgi:quercetin dioxygenase-like cupin family protein
LRHRILCWMEIITERLESQRGPEEWFSGEVWLDAVATALAPSQVRVLSVHFAPGARTAWHTHPVGQVLYVTEGEGRVQRRGGPVEAIKIGDTILLEAGEEHWHGAAPTRFMTHIAIQEADAEGISAHWGEHVTDEEYLVEPSGP